MPSRRFSGLSMELFMLNRVFVTFGFNLTSRCFPVADFETLVENIYEASVDPDLWPSVLNEVSGVAGAVGTLFAVLRDNEWVGWRCSAALEPSFSNYLTSEAATRSLATARLVERNHPGFLADHQLLTDEEYAADPLMTNFGAPNGFHRAAATAIHVPTGEMIVVHVQRKAGLSVIDADDLRRLDALRPHLARAGILSARWKLQRLRAAVEALALIGLPAAVLGRSGRALAANALIQDMNSFVVWGAGDRVRFYDSSASNLLEQAVHSIDDPAATTTRSFPLIGGGGSPAVAHVIPVTGDARDLFGGGFAILAITPVSGPSAPDIALIRALFDLTPAEAKVASNVAQGLTVEQIAGTQSVAKETVRSQLKAVFAKTGVNRQAELAALLAAMPKIPLPGPDDRDR